MSRLALADVSAAAAYVPTRALEGLLTSLAAWVQSPVDTAVLESVPGAGTTLLLHVFESRQRGLRPVWFSPFLHIEAESLEPWLAALAFGSSPAPTSDWLATLARPTAPHPLLLIDDAHAASPGALEALAALRRTRAPRLRICLAGCRGPALARAASVVADTECLRLELPAWTEEELVELAEAERANPALDRKSRAKLAALDLAALAAAAHGSPRLLRNALMLRCSPLSTAAAAAPEEVHDEGQALPLAPVPAPEPELVVEPLGEAEIALEPAPETTASPVAAAAAEATDDETQAMYHVSAPELEIAPESVPPPQEAHDEVQVISLAPELEPEAAVEPAPSPVAAAAAEETPDDRHVASVASEPELEIPQELARELEPLLEPVAEAAAVEVVAELEIALEPTAPPPPSTVAAAAAEETPDDRHVASVASEPELEIPQERARELEPLVEPVAEAAAVEVVAEPEIALEPTSAPPPSTVAAAAAEETPDDRHVASVSSEPELEIPQELARELEPLLEPVAEAAAVEVVAEPEIALEPTSAPPPSTVAAAAGEETHGDSQLVSVAPAPELEIAEELAREPEPVELVGEIAPPSTAAAAGLEEPHDEGQLVPLAPAPELEREPDIALEPAPELLPSVVPAAAAEGTHEPPDPSVAWARAGAPIQLELPFDRVVRAPEPRPRVIEVDLAALPEPAPVAAAPRVEVSAVAAASRLRAPRVPRRSWGVVARRAATLALGFGVGFAAFTVLTRPESPPGPAVAAVSAPPPAPAPPPVLHEVQVNAQPWATIRIDGESVGVTPLLRRGVSGGEHEFEATFPDGRQVRRTVRISPESRFVSFR